MSNTETPTSEPLVVERHTLQVQLTIDELGRIAYAVIPDREVRDTQGVSFLELACRGEPLTRVATAILAHELDRHLLVEVLERTEMRFRRAGRWEEALRPGVVTAPLTETSSGSNDRHH